MRLTRCLLRYRGGAFGTRSRVSALQRLSYSRLPERGRGQRGKNTVGSDPDVI